MSELTFKEFKVTWTIEVNAVSPEEAAKEVFGEFFRNGSDATCFEVEPSDGSTGYVLVDVADLQEEEQS